jgi:hypothetical protein
MFYLCSTTTVIVTVILGRRLEGPSSTWTRTVRMNLQAFMAALDSCCPLLSHCAVFLFSFAAHAAQGTTHVRTVLVQIWNCHCHILNFRGNVEIIISNPLSKSQRLRTHWQTEGLNMSHDGESTKRRSPRRLLVSAQAVT